MSTFLASSVCNPRLWDCRIRFNGFRSAGGKNRAKWSGLYYIAGIVIRHGEVFCEMMRSWTRYRGKKGVGGFFVHGHGENGWKGGMYTMNGGCRGLCERSSSRPMLGCFPALKP